MSRKKKADDEVKVVPVVVKQRREEFYQAVTVTLTEQERAERGQELAETLQTAARRKTWVADRIKGLRDSLKPLKEDAAELVEIVASGRERRQVRCERVFDYENCTSFVVRTDTGEQIGEARPLNPDEHAQEQPQIPGTTASELRVVGGAAASGEAEPSVRTSPPALGVLGDVWPGDPDAKPEAATAEEAFGKLVASAIEVIRVTQRASVSTLQRRLRIAYSAADKVMTALEERGVVGPPKGDAPREILNLPPETNSPPIEDDDGAGAD